MAHVKAPLGNVQESEKREDSEGFESIGTKNLRLAEIWSWAFLTL